MHDQFLLADKQRMKYSYGFRKLSSQEVLADILRKYLMKGIDATVLIAKYTTQQSNARNTSTDNLLLLNLL